MKQMNKPSKTRSHHIQRLLDTPKKARSNRIAELVTVASIVTLIVIGILVGTRVLALLVG
ncbi:MAG TPA: hypothetical protein VFG50_04680 [Rhodothermales bacterium]|nr:hypothetical protein [Rhodothermales bacterium]